MCIHHQSKAEIVLWTGYNNTQTVEATERTAGNNINL